MFKYHLSREESADQSLNFDDGLNCLFINLNAIFILLPIREILLVLLLKMSFLLILVNKLFVNFLWRSFTKSLHMKWRIALFFLLRSSRRYFKVLLIEICMTSIVCVLPFRVLMLFVILLVLALLLHLLHWIIKPEIPTLVHISTTCRHNSVNYIISGHIIVIGRTHLIMPVLVLLIDFAVIVILVLSMMLVDMPFISVLRAPRIVGIWILETAVFWMMVNHSGQRRLLQNIRFVKSVPMIIDIASGLHSIRTFWRWELSYWWFSHCLYQTRNQSVKLGESGVK